MTAEAQLSGSFERSTRLDERPAASPGAHPGRIQHIALSWLREPGNSEHIRAWVDAVAGLATIPGVETAVVGPAAPVTWGDPDESFDLALTIVFESREAMELYQPHPVHHQAIELSNRIMKRVYACYVELDAFTDLEHCAGSGESGVQ